MAKIYAAPKEIKEADFVLLHTGADGYKKFEQASQEYISQVQEYAKKNGKGSEAGEIISFGVADGAAKYVVFSLKPVTLIHLRVGDAYQFKYAHLLTAKAIKEEIQRSKAITKLFASK